MTTYAVLNEHTLGFYDPERPAMFHILHTSPLKGSSLDRLAGFTYVTTNDTVRTATKADFEDYRVLPPPGLFDLPPWTPLEPATLEPIRVQTILDVQAAYPQLTREAILEQHRRDAPDAVYLNSRYQVNVYSKDRELVWLSIKKRDKTAVGPERYRDFMAIKDQLMGPEYEAFEVYPARSRETDTANQYHLWVLPKDTILPVGFNDGRNIVVNPGATTGQQPFEEHHLK